MAPSPNKTTQGAETPSPVEHDKICSSSTRDGMEEYIPNRGCRQVQSIKDMMSHRRFMVTLNHYDKSPKEWETFAETRVMEKVKRFEEQIRQGEVHEKSGLISRTSSMRSLPSLRKFPFNKTGNGSESQPSTAPSSPYPVPEFITGGYESDSKSSTSEKSVGRNSADLAVDNKELDKDEEVERAEFTGTESWMGTDEVIAWSTGSYETDPTITTAVTDTFASMGVWSSVQLKVWSYQQKMGMQNWLVIIIIFQVAVLLGAYPWISRVMN